MLELTKNWRQLAREAIHEKDPEKLILLANNYRMLWNANSLRPLDEQMQNHLSKTAKRPTTNIQAASEREV